MILWLTAALAQTPVVSPADAVTLYVVGDAPVAAKRYADAPVGSGGEVVTGSSGTVLFRENGWVRLRLTDRYVWVPEASTSTEAPARPSALEGLDLQGLDLKNLDLGTLGEGLKLDQAFGN